MSSVYPSTKLAIQVIRVAGTISLVLRVKSTRHSLRNPCNDKCRLVALVLATAVMFADYAIQLASAFQLPKAQNL